MKTVFHWKFPFTSSLPSTINTILTKTFKTLFWDNFWILFPLFWEDCKFMRNQVPPYFSIYGQLTPSNKLLLRITMFTQKDRYSGSLWVDFAYFGKNFSFLNSDLFQIQREKEREKKRDRDRKIERSSLCNFAT